MMLSLGDLILVTQLLKIWDTSHFIGDSVCQVGMATVSFLALFFMKPQLPAWVGNAIFR